MSSNLVVLVAALIGAAGAAVGVVWRLSGRITTSAAQDLWAENTRIKEEYRREIQELRDRLSELEDRNDDLAAEKGMLRRTVDAHEATIWGLRGERDRLHVEIEKLRTQIALLLKEA